MNTVNTQNISFTAKISSNVHSQIMRQSREYPGQKALKAKLSSQLEKVSGWGSADTEIVTCKHPRKKTYGLGLKVLLKNGRNPACIIEKLPGHTELSQFLRLTEKHILDTEETIKFLYDKYGIDIFKHYEK